MVGAVSLLAQSVTDGSIWLRSPRLKALNLAFWKNLGNIKGDTKEQFMRLLLVFFFTHGAFMSLCRHVESMLALAPDM